MQILIRAVLLLSATALLSACVTNPNADQGQTAQAYDPDCYVTGSLIKIRGADCAKARSDRGVNTADPKDVKVNGTTAAGGSSEKGR
jgi:uncharacterized lipoprotein YajG